MGRKLNWERVSRDYRDSRLPEGGPLSSARTMRPPSEAEVARGPRIPVNLWYPGSNTTYTFRNAGAIASKLSVAVEMVRAASTCGSTVRFGPLEGYRVAPAMPHTGPWPKRGGR